MSKPSVLVFGATGAIGGELAKAFKKEGFAVTAVTRLNLEQASEIQGLQTASWDVLNEPLNKAIFEPVTQYQAIIFAQGTNLNDDIYDFQIERHLAVYQANVLFILKSLNELLQQNCLADGAKLCIVSSIWQNLARQKKLSYSTSKSALKGMIQSLAVDLGNRGILVNAILPGALDTPMTRENLNPEQIRTLQSQTPLGSLPTTEDLNALAVFLCSEKNTGITGQFIAVDRGFSHARIL